MELDVITIFIAILALMVNVVQATILMQNKK